ncbi:dienelactone hydrolase family protein [Phenylobacterium sp. J426]|uniref:dienelactone hydrolase family protein n=1 Tax=Phenylobacterium sp. J426 TaxID=2898439 RepID=UPI002151CF8F|nr:dienelactone hydrolase family protein [Phenylobacterium sp. J426]MCR5876113.1 dienelactone hydrolase family protein [Phenylobacterium sp. J426]
MPEAWIEIAAEDGHVDAWAVWPEGEGRRPPVVVLADRTGRAEAERMARRLAAHGYFVLAPDWAARPADERRADTEAWLDWLADERRIDDARVGVVGWRRGADLALKTAAWRAERVSAAAALFGRGFGAATAAELAQRLNALVHLGYAVGRPAGPGMAALEAALCAADVNFETETYGAGEEDRLRGRLLDLFDRTLTPRLLGAGVNAVASPP